MNKNIIKIGVPVMVLCGIIAIVAITQKPIDELSSDMRIKPLGFNAYVDKYIKDSVDIRPKSASCQGYQKLYEIITTETSIMVTRNSEQDSLISSGEAAILYERAFQAYYSIYDNDASQLFASSTWDESKLSEIKTEAEDLSQRKGISSSASQNLKKYIEYVNEYYSAIGLIKRSRYCSSASEYNSCCNKAKSYQVAPYSNNSKLKNIAKDVSDNAQTGWRNSITNFVEMVCGRSCSYYSSYEDFYNGDYLSAKNKINEYNNTFDTSWGRDLKNKLDNKNVEIMQCFK